MAAKRKGATVRITKNSITIRGIGSGPVKSFDVSGPAADSFARGLMGLPPREVKPTEAPSKGEVVSEDSPKDGE